MKRLAAIIAFAAACSSPVDTDKRTEHPNHGMPADACGPNCVPDVEPDATSGADASAPPDMVFPKDAGPDEGTSTPDAARDAEATADTAVPDASDPDVGLTCTDPEDCPQGQTCEDNRCVDICKEPVPTSATPSQAIYVELLWDTPADPDQTDAAGTDMDIHLKRGDAAWDNAPGDCFWNNANTDWGCELLIDDTGGRGPEALAVEVPGAVEYHAGAHYFAANGYGFSCATMRVWLNGQLEYENQQYMPGGGKFLHAATIDGETMTVDPVEMVSDGFPMAP